MKKGPVNSYSLKWSLSFHGALLALAVVLPLLPMFRKKELAIPLDFTVVLEENEVAPNVPPQPEPPPKTPEPPKPEPEPDPPKPVPIPDPVVKDPVVVKKVEKPKPPEKKPDPPPPKKKPEPPKPPEKKPFVKGTRVEARPAQPSQDFTKLKPVTTAPVTEKRLTKAEIAKALQDGAKPGTRNVLPEDEVSRCVMLVRRAMYEAWEQPGAGDAGPRPALLDIRLDSSGRVVSYRIRQSSGSAYFDQTVLKAAANVAPIRGLSLAFLKQYETLTVEFKLE